ncbi:MAG: hypothetical protein LQ343_007220 [Gyalolechia ehrenbergii]|nr:MAG: hypothetical protein LQ343_007220 [Gyalolechia ehrenbergii]
MANTQDSQLDEILWKAPLRAQEMGGIQTNTVLPYFSESPYFDATSNNATIMTQATHNPALFYLIQTREAFEARLRTMQGLEFMVAHDPSDNGTKVEHSGIWVIRRQIRRKRAGTEDEITPISSFYVVGENIYMASSLGSVLGARLLATVTSLNKVIATASALPSFTPALGHTYLPPAPRALNPVTSKEGTPVPGSQDSTSVKPASKQFLDQDLQSAQLLQSSLNLSLRYGHEYMDDNPLVGEPGSFIITKTRDAQQPVSQPKAKPAAASTRPPTPQIKADVPEPKRKPSMGTERSPTTPGTKEKKARRKSRPATSVTTPK